MSQATFRIWRSEPGGAGAFKDYITEISEGMVVLDAVQHSLGFRLSFRHLVQETLGIERPDDSLRTLQWYQEGDRERIVQQGCRDLELLRALVRYGASTGTVLYRDAAGVRTTIPVHWQRLQQYG